MLVENVNVTSGKATGYYGRGVEVVYDVSTAVPTVLHGIVIQGPLDWGLRLLGATSTVPVRISDLRMEGAMEVGVWSSGSSPVSIDHGSIHVSGTALLGGADVNSSVIEGAPCMWSNQAIATINNSTLVGDIVNYVYSNAYWIGHSKIVGQLGYGVKTIGCYDAAYEPIADGWHYEVFP